MEIRSESVGNEESTIRRPVFQISDVQHPEISFVGNDIHGGAFSRFIIARSVQDAP